MIKIYTIFLTLALPCLALPCLASILYLNKLNLIISISKNITLIYGIFNKFSINSYKNNIFINIQNFILRIKITLWKMIKTLFIITAGLR